jgi:hypothetical protein
MRKSYFVVAGLLTIIGAVGAGMRAHPAMSDKAAIEALEKQFIKAFVAKDVNAIMALYAPVDQLFVFDAVPPREYPSWEAYKQDGKRCSPPIPAPSRTPWKN